MLSLSTPAHTTQLSPGWPLEGHRPYLSSVSSAGSPRSLVSTSPGERSRAANKTTEPSSRSPSTSSKQLGSGATCPKTILSVTAISGGPTKSIKGMVAQASGWIRTPPAAAEATKQPMLKRSSSEPSHRPAVATWQWKARTSWSWSRMALLTGMYCSSITCGMLHKNGAAGRGARLARYLCQGELGFRASSCMRRARRKGQDSGRWKAPNSSSRTASGSAESPPPGAGRSLRYTAGRTPISGVPLSTGMDVFRQPVPATMPGCIISDGCVLHHCSSTPSATSLAGQACESSSLTMKARASISGPCATMPPAPAHLATRPAARCRGCAPRAWERLFAAPPRTAATAVAAAAAAPEQPTQTAPREAATATAADDDDDDDEVDSDGELRTCGGGGRGRGRGRGSAELDELGVCGAVISAKLGGIAANFQLAATIAPPHTAFTPLSIVAPLWLKFQSCL
mmetsp:Transcript_26515/g.85785  ORF Transcript_26515/g.85785 Transcript_26515/m.85785 type:complete len:455 (+) Transcript_26515:908-2272(+)